MSWSCVEVSPEGKEWQDLLDREPHLLFHEPLWAKVIAESLSSRVIALVFREQEVIRSGAMGFIIGGLGVRVAYFSYPYGSVFGNPPPMETFVKLLKQFAVEQGICQMQFVGYPGGPRLSGAGLSVREDTTQVLRVAGMSKEDLWKSYRRSRRQDIRKVSQRGVVVEETRDAADIAEVHRCYLQTMQATGGVARYRQSLLRTIVDHVAPAERGRMYVARHEGTVIAGMLIVDSQQLSHGLLLAAKSEARALQPNKLLLHTAAERAIEDGKDGLDYMPSGQSAQGVSQFKNLWGAEAVSISHATLVTLPVRSWLWRSAYAAASWAPCRALIAFLRRNQT